MQTEEQDTQTLHSGSTVENIETDGSGICVINLSSAFCIIEETGYLTNHKKQIILYIV